MLRTAAPAVSNPFMGNKMSYRVAAAPAPSTTAFRQVTTMAKKKGVRLIVTVECTEAKGEGATPSRYVTQKVGAFPKSRFAAAAGLGQNCGCESPVGSAPQ